MKRITILALALLTFALLTIPAAVAAPARTAEPSLMDQILKRGVLRVGFSSFVPWAMQGKNGEFIGFEVDVAKRLASDLGVEIQLVPTRWAGIIPALLADKFDVIIGSMSVTTERNLKGNFTIPYDFATIEALANKRKTEGMRFPEDYNKPDVIIAVRSGSTPALVAKKLFPKATVRPFDDEAPAVQDVIAGRSHMMLSSAPLPAFESLKNPDVLYQPTTKALSSQPVGFVIRKGDVDTLNVLDNWIRMVEAEGWLAERRAYWFRGTDWEALIR